jgi:DNA-directed RNA polymerase specialized sigma subunit
MSFDTAAPNDTRNESDEFWANATNVESGIGITATAVRHLWSHSFDHEPATAELVALAFAPDWSLVREAAREVLTQTFIGTVKRIIAAHTRRADAEDVRQAAIVGMWSGLRAFNPEKHRSPVACIQREVLAALDDVHAARFGMKVPEAHRLAYSKARAEAAKRVMADDGNGLAVDDLAAEIAPEFGISTIDYWHVDRVVHLAGVASDGTVTYGLNSGDIDASAGDYAPQPDVAPLVTWDAPNAARDMVVSALLGTLDVRSREVVARYFGLDGYAAHTDEEIGTALGVTKMRANQIRNKAFASLRLA